MNQNEIETKKNRKNQECLDQKTFNMMIEIFQNGVQGYSQIFNVFRNFCTGMLRLYCT